MNPLRHVRPGEPVKVAASAWNKIIEEVKFHLVLAAFLVIVTIFIFLRDWRATLIAATAVPTSIVGTVVREAAPIAIVISSYLLAATYESPQLVQSNALPHSFTAPALAGGGFCYPPARCDASRSARRI